MYLARKTSCPDTIDSATRNLTIWALLTIVVQPLSFRISPKVLMKAMPVWSGNIIFRKFVGDATAISSPRQRKVDPTQSQEFVQD